MITVIIFCLYFIHVENVFQRSINNYDWKFTHHLTNSQQISTSIPNGIYSDLQGNNLIGDIFLQSNDLKYRLVAERDDLTYYYCYFTRDEEIEKASNVWLVFHGIDGTADIHFNDKKLGSVSNTFVRYQFDITGELQNNNKIVIIFDAPIKRADEISQKFADYNNSSHQLNQFHINNVHLLRRMQASFGAEWAPAIPSFGIWNNVNLIAFHNDVFIRNITVTTRRQAYLQNWAVTIGIHFDIPILKRNEESSKFHPHVIGTTQAFLSVENGEVIKSNRGTLIRNSPIETNLNLNLLLNVSLNKVKLWWPNGHGTQKLYRLKVRFYNKFNPGKFISKSIRMGFRTVQIVQHPLYKRDETRFYFTVNYVPIFAKGTSFLPVSILLEKSSNRKKIEYLLRSAKAVFMNMIRIPAGGIYQSDFFYQKCDEYGLLVWQEMMFDREMYPYEDEEFTQSITQEITQQYLRLQHHPSIAVWVANNEIEVTLSQIKDKTKQEERINEYKTFLSIFKNVIKNDLRPHRSSTPSNLFTRDPNRIIISENQNSLLLGDVHILSINNTWIVEDNESVPRFASQYGARSLPSFESLKARLSDEDISSLYNEFIKQKNLHDTTDPYVDIIEAVSKHFGFPKQNSLDALIYASQITQAWSMKLQTENYRTWSPYKLMSPLSTGLTMGALMWYLNDVWPMPSASSIEYNGKWKMLHYYARQFFSPVASSLEITSSQKITIYLISDLKMDIPVILQFEIFYWSNLQPIYVLYREILLKKLVSFEYMDIELMNILNLSCNTPGTFEITETCLLKLTIFERNQALNTNYLLPAKVSLRNIYSLPNPQIQIELIQLDFMTFLIRMYTDSIALFVWLDVGNIEGVFSENGFIMTEWSKDIIFYPWNPVTYNEIQSALTYKAIGKNYLHDNFS